MTDTLKSAALTLFIALAGGAMGWLGMRTFAQPETALRVDNGDYSKIIDGAQHPMVLFATSTCPFCRKARALLDAAKADYRVYEIDTSAEARTLYQAMDVKYVPVLVTRSARIVGYSETLYRLHANDPTAAARPAG